MIDQVKERVVKRWSRSFGLIIIIVMLSYVKYRLPFTLLEMRPGQALYQSKRDTQKKRNKTKKEEKETKATRWENGVMHNYEIALNLISVHQVCISIPTNTMYIQRRAIETT